MFLLLACDWRAQGRRCRFEEIVVDVIACTHAVDGEELQGSAASSMTDGHSSYFAEDVCVRLDHA